MEDGVAIEPVAPSDPDAEALMAMLDAEVDALYGGTTSTGALPPEERDAFNGVFLLARRRGAPTACGAVRFLDDGSTGELKRIYAKPEERGSGVARALVGAFERAAAERGLSRVVLTSADRLNRAVRFYESLGYTLIPPYGEHAGKQWAVCFEKRLPERREDAADA